ncbi:MAG TPA: hypothetical protein GX701_00255 [Clostridiales bacterium]|nr:hypothetical protein [Clostridiales bacterium]
MQKVINKAHAKNLAKKTLMNISACMESFVKNARQKKATTLYPEDLSKVSTSWQTNYFAAERIENTLYRGLHNQI